MNVAIILAVSDYSAHADKLPACKADGIAMRDLLAASGKFEKIDVIDGDQHSAQVKRQLIESINALKSKNVEEIFFYFSGHGQFTNGEFYFLLKDFDPARRMQTTIENAELDCLLKSVNPSLAIKAVDACQSGVEYIKDIDAINLQLDRTKGGFKKCYFMFSSLSDQYSYVNQDLSFFTRAILDCVSSFGETELRYKDVCDSVADDFRGSRRQTPFFVIQADLVEPFICIDGSVRAAVDKALGKNLEAPAESGLPSIVDLIADDAKRYCNEAEATEAIRNFQAAMKDFTVPQTEIALFNTTIKEGHDFADLPNATSIGNWLDQNPEMLFAEPFREPVTRTKRVPKKLHALSAASILFPDENDFEIVEFNEMQIRGFKPTVALPFLYLKISAEPKFPNLTPSECFAVPLVSKTELKVFFCCCSYRSIGWSRRQREGEIRWEILSAPLRQDAVVTETATSILKYFWSEIMNGVKSKFLGDSASASSLSGTSDSENHTPRGDE